MGYTTRFEGAFTLTPKLTLEQYGTLMDLSDSEPRTVPGAPDAYCQWEPSRSGDKLAWDGNEKFYGYTAWLQFILDKYLTPWGITLSGEVQWAGEAFDDRGTLSVEAGTVRAVAVAPSGRKVTCPKCDHEFRVQEEG